MSYKSFFIPIVLIVFFTACGGGGGNGDDTPSPNPDPNPDPDPTPQTYSVGGTISGNSNGIALSLNGSAQSFTGGAFAFTTELDDSASYDVQFVSAGANESCTIVNGSGTIAGADVSNINVTCANETSRNQRIATMRYDFDLNGVEDGVANLSYNADGRIERIVYFYTDDGTPDTDFRTFSLDFGNEDASHDYAYDDQGRLTTWTITKDTSRLEHLYTWNDENLVTNYAIEFYDDTEALENTLRFALIYENGRLVSWSEEFELAGSAPTALANGEIEYDPVNNLPFTILRTDLSGGISELMIYGFGSFTGLDGFFPLSIITSVPDLSIAISTTSFLHATQDGNGALAGQILEFYMEYDDPADDYSWLYTYSNGVMQEQRIDIGIDDISEATITYEWEEGLCLPVYLWAPRATPNFIAQGDEPYIPATGYMRLDYCDTRGSRL